MCIPVKSLFQCLNISNKLFCQLKLLVRNAFYLGKLAQEGSFQHQGLSLFSFTLDYFVAISTKSGIVGPHLTKGMCAKCLANSSYVVLPFRDFYPVRLEAVI